MAITNIEISQDNIVNDSNLVPIHSPVVFLVDVTYNSTAPENVHIDIIEDTVVLATFRLIPYSDLSATVRQFAFQASEPVLSLMDRFDDTLQLADTLMHIPEITKTLTLNFFDPLNTSINDSVTITFAHAVNQFGQEPNLESIYENETQDYMSAKDAIVYVYFYNSDPSNVLSIDTGELLEAPAEDFDDSDFTDSNDELFTINITT